MPPAPVTPSPHRFVIKKQSQAQKTPLARGSAARPSSDQFNATPRFSFSSNPRSAGAQNVPLSTPSSARYLTPARPAATQEDAIEQSSDDFPHDVVDSTETEAQGIDPRYLCEVADDDFEIAAPSSKRRRLSSSPVADGTDHADADADEDEGNEITKGNDGGHESISSSLSIVSSPPATRRPISSMPRFHISTPVPPSTPQVPGQAIFLKPPRFRPEPPVQPPLETDPLPEKFSPHRKGQKFVDGGLAAEVRDWLVDIRSGIPPNTVQSQPDPWVLKVRIDEISGGGKAGMILVRGRQIDSGAREGVVGPSAPVRIILAREESTTNLQMGTKLEVGKVVGVKRPILQVVIGKDKWSVGTDWNVLAP